MKDTPESIEFSNNLYKKYPRLFKKPVHIDHHPGWYPIIEDLAEDLYELSLQFTENSITFQCIRDKLGGMRCYVEYHLPGDEIFEIEQIVRKYEKMSLKTCEECGKKGKVCVPKLSWFATLCNECLSKYEEKDGIRK